MQPVALVVVVDDVPQRLLRAVVKIRPRQQYVAQTRCLEGGDIGLLLGDQKAAKGGHVCLNGGAIDGLGITRVDQLLGLTRQCDDIVSDDADADVVKVIVREGCDVPLLFRQRVAFIAATLGVEKLPAALRRIVDGIPIACNEVIKGRIERNLRPFVGRDGPHQVGAPLGG